jgi:hypothetical protein
MKAENQKLSIACGNACCLLSKIAASSLHLKSGATRAKFFHQAANDAPMANLLQPRSAEDHVILLILVCQTTRDHQEQEAACFRKTRMLQLLVTLPVLLTHLLCEVCFFL